MGGCRAGCPVVSATSLQSGDCPVAAPVLAFRSCCQHCCFTLRGSRHHPGNGGSARAGSCPAARGDTRFHCRVLRQLRRGHGPVFRVSSGSFIALAGGDIRALHNASPVRAYPRHGLGACPAAPSLSAGAGHAPGHRGPPETNGRLESHLGESSSPSAHAAVPRTRSSSATDIEPVRPGPL